MVDVTNSNALEQLPTTPAAGAPTTATAPSPEDSAREQMVSAYNKLAGIQPEAKTDSDATKPNTDAQAKTDAQVATDASDAGKGRQAATDGQPALVSQSRELLSQFSSFNKPDRKTGKTKLDAMDDATAISQALEHAKAALRRWKYHEVMNLDEQPDEWLLARAAEIVPVQSQQDAMGNEKARLQQMLNELGIKPAAQQATTPAKEQSETNIAGDASNQSGKQDGKAEALLAAMESDDLFKPLVEPFRQLLAEQEQQLAELRQGLDASPNKMSPTPADDVYFQQDALHLELARRDLRESMPEIMDDARFQQVKAKVYELGALPGYRDESGHVKWAKLVSDAAMLEGLGTVNKQQVQAKLLERQKKQKDGQLTDETERSLPATAMNAYDIQVQAVKMLQQGKTQDEVRNWIASAKVA